MDVVNRLFSRRALRGRIADNRDRLYAVALAWSGDAMVADDLVQETLYIALSRVAQLREKEKLNAWMYSILSNCWKQHLRRMRPTLDIEDAGLADAHDTERGCCEQEIVDCVRRAILRLPDGQRQVVTLVDLAGFTYAEVAEVLDIPIGTVMSRLHTARRSLQSVLARIRAPQPRKGEYLRSVK